MSEPKSRLEQLRESHPREALRLVWRKAIYRKVLIGEFGIRAGDSVAPPNDHGLVIDLLNQDDWHLALENNPYLNEADLARFRNQAATCIVARDGNRIAASTWMLRGGFFVTEVSRELHLRPDTHFSCRSFVASDYRGRALLSHMIHHYAMSIDPDNQITGLVFDWNIPSIRSLERIGWRHRGDYWTTFVLGRAFHHEQHFPPRPPITLSNTES
ncbi:MAG: hypothetical protein KDB26_12675 [Microthrixaceae bacterium]|nr:hypothetical protein [Microthrixaceae bacterium]